MEGKNLILDLSFDFASDIISYCEILDSQKKFVVSRQLLKSGTSIGANVREAQDAESKTDFIHKMKIASKEASETEYWLLLCRKTESYPASDSLLDKVIVLRKLLSKIIYTSKSTR